MLIRVNMSLGNDPIDEINVLQKVDELFEATSTHLEKMSKTNASLMGDILVSFKKKDIKTPFNISHFQILKAIYVSTKDNLYPVLQIFGDMDWSYLSKFVTDIESIKLDCSILEIMVMGKMKKKSILDRDGKKLTINTYREKYSYFEQLLHKLKTQLAINELFTMKLLQLLQFNPQIKQAVDELHVFLEFEKVYLNMITYSLQGFCIDDKYTLVQEIDTTTATIDETNKVDIPAPETLPSTEECSQTIEELDIPMNKEPVKDLLKMSVDKKKRELEKRELEERCETVPQKKKKTIEVVRKKDLRSSLYGGDCNECRKFYHAMYGNDPEKMKEMIQQCSRHRTTFSPDPGTPEGYWDLSFADSQEAIEVNA